MNVLFFFDPANQLRHPLFLCTAYAVHRQAPAEELLKHAKKNKAGAAHGSAHSLVQPQEDKRLSACKACLPLRRRDILRSVADSQLTRARRLCSSHRAVSRRLLDDDLACLPLHLASMAYIGALADGREKPELQIAQALRAPMLDAAPFAQLAWRGWA